jgi:hypothetical protein
LPTTWLVVQMTMCVVVPYRLTWSSGVVMMKMEPPGDGIPNEVGGDLTRFTN